MPRPSDRRVQDSLTLVTLCASVALLVVGYLLDTVKLEPFAAGFVLLILVAAIGMWVGTWAMQRSARRIREEVSEQLARSSDKQGEASHQLERAVTENIESSVSKLTIDLTRLQIQVAETLGRVEHAVFSHLIGNGGATTPGAAHGTELCSITQAQVAAIEEHASEVWVYTYDLNWDTQDSTLGAVIENNLREAVQYRFLVPNQEDVLLRVKAMGNRYRQIPDLEKLLKFRIRPREVPFARFGISIYDPTFDKSSEDRRSMAGRSCVVLFPHFANRRGEGTDAFVKLSGPVVAEYEAEFLSLWENADPYEMRTILK
jgi:hypothetical protein